MTPEQIALSSLEVLKVQTWITGLAIFLGPLAGVLFTFWFQSRKDRDGQRHRLFLALMGERKSLVISKNMAEALNSIDVVFADRPKVKGLWHKYYGLLSLPAGEERAHTWLELLAAMAEDLRYFHISQTDLDKFYIPQGHVDDLEFQRNMSQQWSRVLKNTERFLLVSIDDANKNTGL
jgi:hypothetical protein